MALRSPMLVRGVTIGRVRSMRVIRTAPTTRSSIRVKWAGTTAFAATGSLYAQCARRIYPLPVQVKRQDMLYIAVLICLFCGAGATVVATQPARRDKQISAEKKIRVWS